MLKIEIIKGHDNVTTRTTDKGVFYSQTAYMHNGGAFPVEIEVSLENATPLLVGSYVLSEKCFRASKYKKLEVNSWDVGKSLVPIDSIAVKKAS